VVAARSAATVKAQLRAELLGAVGGSEPGWLSGQRAGEIATLTGRGLDGLDAYFTGYLPQLVLTVTVPLAVLARLVFADWSSALIIAVTLPLIPIFGGGEAARRGVPADEEEDGEGLQQPGHGDEHWLAALLSGLATRNWPPAATNACGPARSVRHAVVQSATGCQVRTDRAATSPQIMVNAAASTATVANPAPSTTNDTLPTRRI
jgi:hypothetical protein